MCAKLIKALHAANYYVAVPYYDGPQSSSH